MAKRCAAEQKKSLRNPLRNSLSKRLHSILLGIGINVNMEEADLKKIDQPATSLKLETNRVWDRQALLKKIGNPVCNPPRTIQKGGIRSFPPPHRKAPGVQRGNNPLFRRKKRMGRHLSFPHRCGTPQSRSSRRHPPSPPLRRYSVNRIPKDGSPLWSMRQSLIPSHSLL